jgi:TPR repeat protein
MSLAYRLLCDRVKIRTWVRFQMSTFQHGSKRSRSSNACNLFLRANEHWDRGELKSAFRLFLRAARAGDSGARVNLGYFYDSGLGVKPNRDLALYWYRRAYRQRSSGAASNIGTVWRDQGKLDRAISWFQRAEKLGDGDANLEIAKVYLRYKHDKDKAIHYLRRVCRAKPDEVMQQSREEAENLLKRIDKTRSRRRQ